MCGIAGIVGTSPVNQRLYDALTVLQHRGQDAAGIVTTDGARLHMRKSNGLVRDVFDQAHMERLVGTAGIGHVRYPTAGCEQAAEAQPFYVNAPYGIALAHNGNLTNADELKREVSVEDLRHLNTESDSEVLLNVLAHELQRRGRLRLSASELFDAIRSVHRRCRGAYAVVGLLPGYGMFAFRDPWGIRPLVFGSRQTDTGAETMIASESVALDVLGFARVRDVAPGEAVFVELDGTVHTEQCAAEPRLRPCIFEHVYLARPDSIIDDISVYKTRLRMGEKLARRIQDLRPDHDIDVVIPVPDTSRTSALQLALSLDVKFREGFIKNRYIGRTFIMPGQGERKRSVRQKLNPISLEFRDKVVLLVDDSIVRGNTCRQIIQLAREAGARKVYFASAAPPVRFPNVYGIDMPSADELIAHGRTVDEICDAIGADWLVYQDVEDLYDSAREGNPEVQEFEASIFHGNYVTRDVDESYLSRLRESRSDDAKSARRRTTTDVSLDLGSA